MADNEPQIHIRAATPDDQQTIDAMNVAASYGAFIPEAKFPETDSFLDEHPDAAAFSRDFGREGDLGLIAEDADGNPLGVVWGREYDRSEDTSVMKDHPFEITMAVREAARSQGIGRTLLDAIAESATELGKDEISLGVHERSPARKLYEAAGYQPVLNEDGSEARVGGSYIIMTLKLQ